MPGVEKEHITKEHIKLGHSPDPDDAFMFYGLAKGLVDSGPFEFEHILRDIQTLNDWALEGKLEVTAISVHAYAYLHKQYAILSSGASMGATELVKYEPADKGAGHSIDVISDDRGVVEDNRSDNISDNISCAVSNSISGVDRVHNSGLDGAHGPLLLCRDQMSLAEIADRKIAIPGTMTSAFLVLKMAIGEGFTCEVMPFNEIMQAVQSGRVAAGVIIHEGQLTYKQAGLHCALDLGRWWYEQTGLVLPLGCNVIRRDLGWDKMQQISRILKNSIAYSLEHRQEAVKYALQFGRGLDLHLADRFVGMYVNNWTLDYGPVGKKAIRTFLDRGCSKGFIPQVEELVFV